MFNQEKRDRPGRKMGNVYGQISWKPIEMIDLKRFKEVVVAYDKFLNKWPTQNRFFPKNWGKLTSTRTQNSLAAC